MSGKKEKPGVMFYFDPMAEQAEKLDDTRLAALMRAVFRYAHPDRHEEPEFEDEVLANVWLYVRSLIDRDDERYRSKRQSRAYSQFCRWYKHFTGRDGAQDIPLDIWTDMGAPTYKEWERAQKPGDTNVSGKENDTNVYPVSSYSDSSSNSPSISFSASNSILGEPGAGAPEFQKRNALSPKMNACFQKWLTYKHQKGQKIPPIAEAELQKMFLDRIERDGERAVGALVDHCIASGWNSIRWEMLDEQKGGRRGGANDEVCRAAEAYRRNQEIRKYLHEGGGQ